MRDAEDLTRQICNAWKSDRTVAATVLRADIGRACARLGGWPGARLSQDNVLWKPPGGRPLGFHQDSSYELWADPPDWVSCWIALDDTTAAGGTVEYVRGSHRWGRSGMIEQFHGPTDHHRELRQAAAAAGVEPECVPVEVSAGGGAFHAGWTWHGSGANRASAAAPGSCRPLHVVEDALQLERDGLHLQPLQAIRRRRHGRVAIPRSSGARRGIARPSWSPTSTGRSGGRGRRARPAGRVGLPRADLGSCRAVSMAAARCRRRWLRDTSSGAGATSTGNGERVVILSRSPWPRSRRIPRRRRDPTTMASL